MLRVMAFLCIIVFYECTHQSYKIKTVYVWLMTVGVIFSSDDGLSRNF